MATHLQGNKLPVTGGLLLLLASCHEVALVRPRPAPAASTSRPHRPATSEPNDARSAAATAPVSPILQRSDCPLLKVPLPELITAEFEVPVPRVVDHGPHELDRFSAKVARMLRGKAKEPIRIAVYGDSNLTRDFITGELRRTLQLAHGDAGHGFIAVARPWSWYWHTDVQHSMGRAWRPYCNSTHHISDGLYGFGGIVAQSEGANAITWVSTAPEGAPVGTRVDRVEVYYLGRPGNGNFDLRVDGAVRRHFEAASDQIEARYGLLDLPDAPHRIELVSGKPPVRVLGLVLERKRPGFVVDSLGVGGSSTPLLMRGNRALMVDTLRHRKYDLAILLMGGTEDALPSNAKAMADWVAVHREALPEASLLISSPPDQSSSKWENILNVTSRIRRIVTQKEESAREGKTAFWDFQAAMGGPRSIEKFTLKHWAWSDSIHLTEPGGRYMGRRFAYALLSAVAEYAERAPRAGCADPG